MRLRQPRKEKRLLKRLRNLDLRKKLMQKSKRKRKNRLLLPKRNRCKKTLLIWRLCFNRNLSVQILSNLKQEKNLQLPRKTKNRRQLKRQLRRKKGLHQEGKKKKLKHQLRKRQRTHQRPPNKTPPKKVLRKSLHQDGVRKVKVVQSKRSPQPRKRGCQSSQLQRAH